MFVNPRLLPSLFFLAAFSLVSPAHADGLNSIMTAKVIKVAVPQDFAPFGSAGSISSRKGSTSTWPI